MSRLRQNTPSPSEQAAPPDCAFAPPCPKAPGRPRAADAEARVQDLVETARRLFLSKGYSKVSLEMIAKEARVAVRTIYVKFGGKAGLFTAVIGAGRQSFFANMDDLDTTRRPLRELLLEFGGRFMALVNSPTVIALHRMVIAETHSNPELAAAFYEVGPKQTRDILMRFFSRPDVRQRLREDMGAEALAVHLLNCIMGDQLKRYLFVLPPMSETEARQQVREGVDLFLGGALRP
ncbi:TetR/AcrR family transcriptional regulator [Pseudoduganella namucuonensis]|uniref:Transcriptional regulator, TetR family n=1 Tax=Pseudoduganella namucuonensis TaxID=1035707 RepID=A0A1I7FGW6_9BURK|nr:TetR/AcrR family transcriptional regulator [Pseudoduganella namucuonensis]SFU35431.1 transcriptional regulator, TetR family [Pseudoduganella namucuonensis]